MKRKETLPQVLVAAFVIFAALYSASASMGQCGTYFKSNYVHFNKLEGSLYNPDTFDDWNGDGRADIWGFQRNPNNSTLDVVIYPTIPAGYWDWDNPIIYTTSLPYSHGNQSGAVMDYDGDGRKDLFYFGQIHRNLGNGSLVASPVISDSDGSWSKVGFGKINNDNLLDFIYIIYGNDVAQLRYQLQNPDGSFGTKTTILVSSAQNYLFYSSKTLGDFNGDGLTDLIYGNAETGNVWWSVVLKNVGGGNFEVQPRIENGVPPSSTIRDFNHDGKDDVVGWGKIYFGRADGAFDVVQLPGVTYSTRPAELNADDNLDLIQFGSGFYATLISDGAGGFTRTDYVGDINPTYTLLFGDFSGDGKADLFQVPDSSSLYSNKNIFGERLISIKENVCQPAGETKMANFDGNANPDITMWNPATGNWSSKNAKWHTNADPTARVYNWGLGALGDIPAPGDFDGDGKTDYAVYRNSNGIWYIRQSSNNAWIEFRFGLPGDIAVPNDYNGGGKSDIAVFRPSNGTWYIWFSETQQFGALHFGTNGDKPVPADYDGDGKTDIAVFRPSDGNWYYLKSSDETYAVFHWGSAADKPVPADYDGDGKADMAIYRDGLWWIWRSSDNTYAVVSWGQPGDVPIPVYRNSLNADLILYRPSNSTWYSYFYHGVPGSGVPLGENGEMPVYFGLPNN